VHQLQPLDTLAIIKAFCNAFHDCTLWDGAGLEWMLMGGNGTNERVPADTFTAQWRDERVHRELVALGFELPEQMGALFMGDAPISPASPANVPPVTDNYPLRISSELVRDPGQVRCTRRSWTSAIGLRGLRAAHSSSASGRNRSRRRRRPTSATKP